MNRAAHAANATSGELAAANPGAGACTACVRGRRVARSVVQEANIVRFETERGRGNGLIYSTYLGGTSQVSFLCCDLAAGVAIDATGNAYITGTTNSSGFPVTTGAAQTKFAASLSSNAYVAKLNPSGTGLVYATFLGGRGQGQFSIGPAVFQGDQATAIAVDGAGNAYVTGVAHSPDFPVTTGAFQTKNKAATISGTVSQIPGYNAFVTKINPGGHGLCLLHLFRRQRRGVSQWKLG